MASDAGSVSADTGAALADSWRRLLAARSWNSVQRWWAMRLVEALKEFLRERWTEFLHRRRGHADLVDYEDDGTLVLTKRRHAVRVDDSLVARWGKSMRVNSTATTIA